MKWSLLPAPESAAGAIGGGSKGGLVLELPRGAVLRERRVDDSPFRVLHNHAHTFQTILDSSKVKKALIRVLKNISTKMSRFSKAL